MKVYSLVSAFVFTILTVVCGDSDSDGDRDTQADAAAAAASSATEADLQSSGAACALADLFLHSPADADGNAQPISTFQSPTDPNTFMAQMDYGMIGFDMEARAVPADRCKLDEMVQFTTMVDPGSTVVVQLTVRDSTLPKSADNMKLFKVQVSRLRGTETNLRALKIANGILVPGWDMNLRNYTSYLDVTQDMVKVIFQRLDNGQVVGLSSSLEEPLDSGGRRLQAMGDPLGPPIGEVQYLPSSLTSTIDVGRQRMIKVVVESADRSTVGSYSFKVQRPFCPEERRFFDGAAKACTDICNEGSFGNPSTGRCSICLQRHCAVCDSQNLCSNCIEGFGLLTGKCVVGGVAATGGLSALTKYAATVQTYSSRHVLLMLGASIAATGGLCACLFVALSSGGSRCSNVRRSNGSYSARSGAFDSDDEYSVRESESFAYS